MLTCIIWLTRSGSAVENAAHVSKSGVVDQQIDRDLLAARPGNQFVDRLAPRQIGWPDFDSQSRMPRNQLRAQFLQPRFAPGDEHKRGHASAELARELTPDPRRSAGNQSRAPLIRITILAS